MRNLQGFEAIVKSIPHPAVSYTYIRTSLHIVCSALRRIQYICILNTHWIFLPLFISRKPVSYAIC